MKYSYSKKILTLSIIIFVIVLVLNIIFTNLLLGKIYSINDKIKQLDISSQEREKALSLKDSIASTKTERENLATHFVGAGNAETVSFTEYLENVALETGVNQKKSLNYESVVELGPSEIISSIRYKFNITGKWSNVLKFVQAMEYLPKVSYLSGVSMGVNLGNSTTTGSRMGEKNWSADLDFSVAKLKN